MNVKAMLVVKTPRVSTNWVDLTVGVEKDLLETHLNTVTNAQPTWSTVRKQFANATPPPPVLKASPVPREFVKIFVQTSTVALTQFATIKVSVFVLLATWAIPNKVANQRAAEMIWTVPPKKFASLLATASESVLTLAPEFNAVLTHFALVKTIVQHVSVRKVTWETPPISDSDVKSLASKNIVVMQTRTALETPFVNQTSTVLNNVLTHVSTMFVKILMNIAVAKMVHLNVNVWKVL